MCRRCGRAFAMVMTEVSPGGVYRKTTIFDLVPVGERKPFFGLDDHGGPGRLDVSVGAAWRFPHGLQYLPLLVGLAFTALIMLRVLPPITSELWSRVIAYATFALPIVIPRALRRGTRDQLSLENDKLVWRRLKGKNLVRERTAQLSAITGAHDRGDHVRIQVDGKKSWRVGDGLNVPRKARRWLAARVAELGSGPDLEAVPAQLGQGEATEAPALPAPTSVRRLRISRPSATASAHASHRGSVVRVKKTGEVLGSASADDIAELAAVLDDPDDDFYVNKDFIALLDAKGVCAGLVAILRPYAVKGVTVEWDEP